MKKLLKDFLVVGICLCFGFTLTSCSKNDSKEAEYESAQTLLGAIWNNVQEDQKPSVIGGLGDEEDILYGEPQALNLENKEALSAAFSVPVLLIDASSSGASLMNAMMANYFTVSCWQIKAGENTADLTKECNTFIKNQQWLCASPEYYEIIEISTFILVVYGLQDTVEAFTEGARKTTDAIEIVYEGPVE